MDKKECFRPKSVERQMIEHVLMGAKCGELVSYDDIEKLVGESCAPGSRVRGLFMTSVHEMLRHGMAFECRPNEGYVLLDTHGIGAHMTHRTKKTHKAANKTVRVGGCAELSVADTATKSTIVGLMMLNQFVAKISSGKAIKKLIPREGGISAIDQTEYMKKLADKCFLERKERDSCEA